MGLREQVSRLANFAQNIYGDVVFDESFGGSTYNNKPVSEVNVNSVDIDNAPDEDIDDDDDDSGGTGFTNPPMLNYWNNQWTQ